MLTFLATGDWGAEQIRVTQVPGGRRIVPEVERLIDGAWHQAQSRPGIRLFDGPMCRLESWRVEHDVLRLTLSDTSYKPFFGTNLSNPELAERYGRDVMANPVGVSPALRTSDNFLLLGRRNSSVAYYPSRIHPFAGCLEPKDQGDLTGAVRRELYEELSLSDRDILDVRCTGIVEDRELRQPELIFRAEVSLTRVEIESQVHADEHHDSVAIPATRDGIEQMIADPALTPVGVASLVLWGRTRFGDEWFATLVRQVASG
jgi:8-oxo-dGTP pyrophosphatase MutT (NUDIX family)